MHLLGDEQLSGLMSARLVTEIGNVRVSRNNRPQPRRSRSNSSGMALGFHAISRMGSIWTL